MAKKETTKSTRVRKPTIKKVLKVTNDNAVMKENDTISENNDDMELDSADFAIDEAIGETIENVVEEPVKVVEEIVDESKKIYNEVKTEGEKIKNNISNRIDHTFGYVWNGQEMDY